MTRKNKKDKELLKCGFRCVLELFKLEPVKMVCYVFLNIVYALAWVLQVVILQKYFDCISDISNSWTKVILGLAGVGGTYFFYHLMDGMSNCYPETINLCVNKKLSLLIHKKISMLEPVEYEDPERLEQINKVLNGSKSLMWVGSVLLDIASYYITYFIFMGSYLFCLDPVLAISILVVFIPVVITKMADIWIFKDLEDDLAPERRKMEYYEKCLSGREYYKETRLLGANSFFTELYMDSLKRHSKLVLKAQLKRNLINCCLNIITALGYGIIVLMLFWKVMQQTISIGAFVSVLTSINNLFRFMHKMVIDRIGWAAENVGGVWNYFRFMDESETNRTKHRSENGFVELQGVGFRYPNGEKNVLEGINFCICENEKIAIVGENGSGKTTLCKIILGLYNPTEGNISYNEKLLDLFENSGISAVFQKFNKYKMTLKENIIISQPDRGTKNTEVEELCKECGIAVDRYSEGVDTLLGKEFGGTDVSGGQWQRIAIARGVHRKGELIIMDEPTAAIDPIEETRIYREFERIGKDRTIVMVTHRLGSVQLADRIIVLKEGRIVQEGTHDELIGKEGEYRKLYLSQKKWYV